MWPALAPLPDAAPLRVKAQWEEGRLSVAGQPVTAAMLRLTVAGQQARLAPCLLCGHLDADPEHLCWPCRTAYRKYVTTGGVCPTCRTMSVIRRVHESGSGGWEECLQCQRWTPLEGRE
ncbi:hypothetical protein [Deinococcus multiflagellatus]|uniref:Double zinc ribbon domain-containing protein n=1 Tax=Deinococcus multiflagellatus TaxID=1656887 RepID=A0ABW1ZPY4_9DEIO